VLSGKIKRKKNMKTIPSSLKIALLLSTGLFAAAGVILTIGGAAFPTRTSFDQIITDNSESMMAEGRQTFRFDTFGDEAFWGNSLQLHLAIEGSNFGGVGPGLSPNAALSLGLKVDVDKLSPRIINQLRHNQIDLNDPAVTLLLLKRNAVVGLTGFFNPNGSLRSVGISCSLCHSTVNNSLTFGIGHRLDGWANRDLNVGAITALSPNLQPVADLLGTDVQTVTAVLNSWGPGKFDAELFLDGKAFNPQQVTDGVVTGTNVSGATLIPNALGLAGYNQHTWTGAWGTVTYWNAFVANIEMHGIGTFFDPRLNDASKFPIAARAGFGNIRTDPDSDRITSKLGALQFYQLAIPAPKPSPGVDFDKDAAARGHSLFRDRGRCVTCHVQPLWTEPGWNLHQPEEIGIDSFQADRAPDNVYKTMNLAGIFVREEGRFMDPANKERFYHDGRFQTLEDVVRHYNTLFNLGLTESEFNDLIEYLKSL
jgi:cytochrome c peroxidase